MGFRVARAKDARFEGLLHARASWEDCWKMARGALGYLYLFCPIWIHTNKRTVPIGLYMGGLRILENTGPL